MRDAMTPEQVAEYLQLSKDTVYRLIRGHRLAAVRIGRGYRVQSEDLDRFLVAHSSRPQVRERLFQRVMEFGERNARLYPGLTSDQILEEFEAADEEEKRQRLARASAG